MPIIHRCSGNPSRLTSRCTFGTKEAVVNMRKALSLFLFAASLVLSSCGGESAVAVIGYIAPAGGDFVLGADKSTVQFDAANCDATGQTQDDCRVNVALDTQSTKPGTTDHWNQYYDSRFAVLATGRLVPDGSPGGNPCTDAGKPISGTVDGDRLDLGACFQGHFVNPNLVRSDDGERFLWFPNFLPNLPEGVWVDIRDERHVFRFTGDSLGCEILGGVVSKVVVKIARANFADSSANPVVPFTRVTSFDIERSGGTESWSGDFVGASGMRLSAGGTELQLQRKPSAAVDCQLPG
jgi:hypothetical protein